MEGVRAMGAQVWRECEEFDFSLLGREVGNGCRGAEEGVGYLGPT